jgi:rsbT co-antagonist protein RsbR
MRQLLVPSTNPIERQQASALQMILIAISVAALVAFFVFLAVLGVNPTSGVPAGSAVLVMLTSLAGVAALRRGYFRLAVLIPSAGLIVAVFFVTVIYGYPAATPFLPAMFVPVILTGLLIETRPLLLIAAASALIAVAIFLINPVIAPFTTMVRPPPDLTIVAVALFLLVLFVMTTIIALFGPVLRQSLMAALARE